jgi:hypothetical protein
MISLILDPEVLHNTDKGNECEATLINVTESKSSLFFVTDRVGEKLQLAYEQFINDNHRNRNKSVAVALAKYILLNAKRRIIVSRSSLSKRVQSIITSCDTHADPYLLELVTELLYAEVSCIVLTLTASSGIGRDCLCQQSIKRQLELEISQLRIIYDLTQPVKIGRLCPSPQTITNKKQHVKMFEQTVESWLSRQFHCQLASVDEHEFGTHSLLGMFTETEFKTILGRQEKVEIDAYCYQTGQKERLVCVGECKLSFSKEYVDIDAVTQLKIGMQVVERWEQKRTDNDGHVLGSCKVQGYIISNVDISEEARKEAKKYGIKFVKVTMPSNWKTDPRWRLSESRFKFEDI